MITASDGLEFETAAALRDQLKTVEIALERQHAVATQSSKMLVGFYREEGDVLEIAVLLIRQGKLVGRRTFRCTGQNFPTKNRFRALSASITTGPASKSPDKCCFLWRSKTPRPKWTLAARGAPSSCLGAPAKSKCKRPKRSSSQAGRSGEQERRGGLREPAAQPPAIPEASLQNSSGDWAQKAAGADQGVSTFRACKAPDTVASRVVFSRRGTGQTSVPAHSVRSVENDDFAAMYEVVSRRFRRALGKNQGKPTRAARSAFHRHQRGEATFGGATAVSAPSAEALRRWCHLRKMRKARCR